MQEVAFRITMEDVIALRHYFLDRSSYAQGIYWAAFAVVPLAIVLIGLSNDSFRFVYPTIFTIVVIVVWVLAYRRLYYWWGDDELKHAYAGKKNRTLFGKHTIQLNEAGIVEETSVSTTRVSWEGIESVEETDSYIFIFMSAVGTFVIPKRSFTDLATANQFFTNAKAHFNQINAQ